MVPGGHLDSPLSLGIRALTEAWAGGRGGSGGRGGAPGSGGQGSQAACGRRVTRALGQGKGLRWGGDSVGDVSYLPSSYRPGVGKVLSRGSGLSRAVRGNPAGRAWEGAVLGSLGSVARTAGAATLPTCRAPVPAATPPGHSTIRPHGPRSPRNTRAGP